MDKRALLYLERPGTLRALLADVAVMGTEVDYLISGSTFACRRPAKDRRQVRVTISVEEVKPGRKA